MPNPIELEGSITTESGATSRVGPYEFNYVSVPGKDKIQLIVKGTWTGTLQVAFGERGEDVANLVADGADKTANFVLVIEPGADCDVYVRATAAMTGTALVRFSRG